MRGAVILLALVIVAAGCRGPGAAKSKGESPDRKAAKEEKSGQSKGFRDVTAPQGQTVEIKGFAFSPARAQVKVGGKITWINRDPDAHNIHLDDDSVKSPEIAEGGKFEQSFGDPGTYTYHCHIHPSMRGEILSR